MGNQLSGGEQQMLAIGRALMTNPRLLILDEATEGLAPLVRDEIWRCLATLRGRRPVDPGDRQECRRAHARSPTGIIIIERGRVVWTGSSRELAAAPDIAAPLSRRLTPRWRQLGLMSANLITLAHFSTSAPMYLLNSDELSVSAPRLDYRISV